MGRDIGRATAAGRVVRQGGGSEGERERDGEREREREREKEREGERERESEREREKESDIERSRASESRSRVWPAGVQTRDWHQQFQPTLKNKTHFRKNHSILG